ncbi:MAG: hypothetical protein ACJ75P_11080 [Gaiellaceae bacterium]
MTVAPELAAPTGPYKGLAPFDASDHDALLFFGRARETEIVTANVLASRLTLLYGPSGVGKSSLLRAGVVRALRQVPEPPAVVAYGSWVGDPLAGIEEASRAAITEAIGREPADAPGGLGDRLAAWTAELGAELCLLLDQLEELFLYHGAAAGGFTDLLPELVSRPGLRVNVLLGIRDDALAQLDVFKHRVPGLFVNSLRLDHLDREAGRDAILGPLERYNDVAAGKQMAIDPGLVDAVLDEVATGRIDKGFAARGVPEGRDPSLGGIETPYLQLVMQRIWEIERERGSDVLRLATLRDLGGAERIVESHLERALAALTPTQRDAAADVFGHLVTPSGTKVAHGVTDLASYAAVGEPELEPVLRSLAHERILRPLGENGHAAGDRYEIFHDVLGQAVLAWRTRHDADVALAREREIARRRHRRLLIVTIVSLFLLGAMSALTLYAFSQREQAREQAAVAQSERVRAEQQSQIAQAQRAEAVRLARVSREASTRAQQQERAARIAESRAKRQEATARRERRRAERNAEAKRAAEAEVTRQALRAQSGEELAARRTEAARKASEEAKRAAKQAERAERTAQGKTAAARVQRRKAERASRRAEAIGLAHEALARLPIDPAESLRQALRAASLAGGWIVEDALRQSLITSHVRIVLPAGDEVATAVFSPDGKQVVTASADGKARLFSVNGDRRDLLHVFRHRDRVASASFDRDGGLVVTASDDGVARIWSAKSGKLVRALAHDGPVASAVFSSDGRVVVTASADGTVGLWRADGDPLRTVRFDGPVRSAVLSPDRDLLVAIVEGPDGRVTARVLTAAGKPLVTLDQRGVTSAAFSPDGTVVATTSTDRTTRLWRPRSGTPIHTLPQREGRVVDAEFSRDGDRIVTASDGGTSAVWDVATGSRMLLLCCVNGAVRSASFSPDGRFVVAASTDRTARVFDTQNGREASRLAGHRETVVGAGFSSDGRRVVTASEDGTARVWDPGTDDALRVLGAHKAPARGAVFSPGGRLVLSWGDDSTARVWQVETGRELQTLQHGSAVTSAAFDPLGSLVATTAPRDGAVRVWSASKGVVLRTLRSERPERVIFSPNGRLLLAIDAANGARVWRLRDEGPGVRLGADRHLTAVAFSPDGRLVVGGDEDGLASIWNARTGRLRDELRGHDGRIVAVAFSPDGNRIATASEDGTAALWNARGRRIRVLRGHRDALTDVRFDRSGRRIVTTSRGGEARLWSSNGKQLAVLRGHFGDVRTASFSGDGRWLVTAGPTTAGLWATRTGELLSLLRGPASALTSASFSPSGHRVVASSTDGTVRTYQCDVCGGLRKLSALARSRLERGRR